MAIKLWGTYKERVKITYMQLEETLQKAPFLRSQGLRSSKSNVVQVKMKKHINNYHILLNLSHKVCEKMSLTFFFSLQQQLLSSKVLVIIKYISLLRSLVFHKVSYHLYGHPLASRNNFLVECYVHAVGAYN